MTHRERYAEACRRAFDGYTLPPDRFDPTIVRRGGHTNLWTKEEAERLVEYCRRGLRSQEIAPLLGRSPKAIQKAFVRFGFPRLHNVCPPCGKDNPAWKGGIHIGANGYRFVKRPDHPHANFHGYVQEHRLVVEEHLGRFLLPSEVVHHKDGNPANDDIDNLEVFASNGEHLRATLSGIRHNVTAEGHRNLSEKTKLAWKDPEMRQRMRQKPDSFSETHKKLWRDPAYRKMMLEARMACRKRRNLLPPAP